jgi:hypothetical protein
LSASYAGSLNSAAKKLAFVGSHDKITPGEESEAADYAAKQVRTYYSGFILAVVLKRYLSPAQVMYGGSKLPKCILSTAKVSVRQEAVTSG